MGLRTLPATAVLIWGTPVQKSNLRFSRLAFHTPGGVLLNLWTGASLNSTELVCSAGYATPENQYLNFGNTLMRRQGKIVRNSINGRNRYSRADSD